jgi:riboflavin kinase/FMN adenylyltransferase
MKLYHDIKGFSASDPVVTTGIFDGVHRGHRYILERLREAAKRMGGESVLVTFWPHPRNVLNKADSGFRLLNTLEEKTVMLEAEGIDHMVVLPFTKSFSRLSSCDFISRYLVGEIGIRHLVVGYNHRFGRDREGDFDKLQECALQFGFGIEKVPPFTGEKDELSSSGIRKCIREGDIERANRLLGWDYSLQGEIVGGSRLGTSIGFPTANITADEEYKLIPADGVYAVLAELKGLTCKGMMNIGSRPTVNDDLLKRFLEVHLLDFNEDIYSERIQVRFMKRLRDEMKFRDVNALKDQLMIDRENTLRFFRIKE